MRVLFDEVALKNQTLVLIGGYNIFKRIDLRYQKRNFRTIVLEIYVLTHTSTELLRLTNINYRARLVFPKIDTWLDRNTVELFLDLLELILIHRKSLKAILLNQGASATRCHAYLSPAHALDYPTHRSLESPRVQDGDHDAGSHQCSPLHPEQLQKS